MMLYNVPVVEVVTNHWKSRETHRPAFLFCETLQKATESKISDFSVFVVEFHVNCEKAFLMAKKRMQSVFNGIIKELKEMVTNHKKSREVQFPAFFVPPSSN